MNNAIELLLPLEDGERFRIKRRTYTIHRGCTAPHEPDSPGGERASFSVLKNNGNSTAIIVRPHDVVELLAQPADQAPATRSQSGGEQKPAKELKHTHRNLEVERKVGVLTVSEGGFMRRTTVRRAPDKWATSRKMTPEELAESREPGRAPTRDDGV